MSSVVPAAQQPDDHPVLHSLKTWIHKETEASYDITTGTRSTRGFIAEGRVQKHFSRNKYEALKRVLLAVFDEQHYQDLPVTPSEVAENCSRVFCILFLIGRARYIQTFIEYDSLSDSSLPFYSAPPDFPKDDNFFVEFHAEQWRFCAPTVRPRGNLRYGDDHILPFLELEKRGAGRTGTVYMVKIHRDHDKLQDSAASALGGQLSDAATSHNYYAVKSMRKVDAHDSYDREAGAFKRLMEGGMRSTPGIIQFFCGFKYKDTFNLVLEYADQGNLADYFHANEPPRGAEDIWDFWEKLLEITAAVTTIHQQRMPGNSRDQDKIING